jgi:acyl-CoA thioesterase FadM
MVNYPFIIETEISEQGLLAPYFHVHHADIIRLLEDGRLELLKAISQPLESFLSQGIFWVITAIQIEYKREVKAGKIKVCCDAVELNGKLLVVKQSIFNDRNKQAVAASISLALFSAAQKRSITIPTDVLASFGL